LEVILELHASIDANDVGTTRWIAKGDVNRKKVCRVVAVMSTTTVTSTDTVITMATEISMDNEISTDTVITVATEIFMDTEISTAIQ
jgi:hypothetical protein